MLLGALALTTACVTQPTSERPDAASAASPSQSRIEPEPRSRYGNGPVYEVLGQRYEVLPSSSGYRERGVASWYGAKFHGRLTSSREPYDMYDMTAAHKSLPLPTWVEVRNLANHRAIIVRVNDRGPFVKNRLIDLSYGAALALDIVESGTGMVEIRAIDVDPPTPEEQRAAAKVAVPEPPSSISSATGSAPPDDAPKIYVQVGAFGDQANAERRQALLKSHGMESAFVHRDAAGPPALFRVRVGPLAGVDHYDRIVSELSRIGIDNSHLIAE